MDNNFIPNPDIIFPIEENSNLTYIRPTIKNYTIEDSSDFSEEFIRIYFQEYKKLN